MSSAQRELVERVRANVPAELRNLPVWLHHNASKVPFYANGQPRQGTLDAPADRAQLVGFDEAAETLVRSSHGCGLGIALGPVGGDLIVSGIDFDHVIENDVLDLRVEQVLVAAGSYAESSPSGAGVHVLGVGDIGTLKLSNVEMYSGRRYFTVTGLPLAGSSMRLADLAPGAHLARKLFDPTVKARRTNDRTGNEHDRTGGPDGKKVREGARNEFLSSEAYRLRKQGASIKQIEYELRMKNALYCDPPLSLDEVHQIARRKASVEPDPQAGVILRRASEIEPEPVHWIWPGWLAAGKLHMLGGVPGTGKTTISISLASIVTAGGRWPNGTSCSERGNVIIWSGEDGLADTLVPRLEAAGADRSRVHTVEGMHDGGKQRPFDPARDIPALRDKARDIGDVRLLIVDPVVVVVSGDSHKNAEVRRGLQPLAKFAEELGAAVLGITHFSKGTAGADPLDRLTGSLAFGAAPRLVLGAIKQQTENGSEPARAFVRIKSNLSADGGGFNYRLEAVELPGGIMTVRIGWGEPIKGTAREIMAQAERTAGLESERSALAEARDFLLTVLADGPVTVLEVMSQAKEAGITEATLRRAKDALGVKSVRTGFGKGGRWGWALPEHQSDHR